MCAAVWSSRPAADSAPNDQERRRTGRVAPREGYLTQTMHELMQEVNHRLLITITDAIPWRVRAVLGRAACVREGGGAGGSVMLGVGNGQRADIIQ